jgi:hypothetical protein
MASAMDTGTPGVASYVVEREEEYNRTDYVHIVTFAHVDRLSTVAPSSFWVSDAVLPLENI